MRFFTDRPFFIPLLILTIVLGGCGIRYLSSLAYQTGERTAPAHKRTKGIYVLIVLLSLFFVYRFTFQNQSDNYMAYDMAKTALTLLPQNSVLHSENSDNTILPVLYLQKVEQFRPDVKIYINMPNSIYNYFQGLQQMETDNPGRKLFTDFPFVLYTGMKYKFMGPVAEIIPDSADDNNAEALNLLSKIKIRGINKSNLDHFHLYLKARYLLDLGLANAKNPERQTQLFKESFAAAPDSQNITGQLIGYTYLMQNNYAEAVPYLETAHNLMPDEYPISFQLALSYVMTGNTDQARQLIEAQNAGNHTLLLKELKTLATQMPEQYPALAPFMGTISKQV